MMHSHCPAGRLQGVNISSLSSLHLSHACRESGCDFVLSTLQVVSSAELCPFWISCREPGSDGKDLSRTSHPMACQSRGQINSHPLRPLHLRSLTRVAHHIHVQHVQRDCAAGLLVRSPATWEPLTDKTVQLRMLLRSSM
jgi:hypothetical protein